MKINHIFVFFTDDFNRKSSQGTGLGNLETLTSIRMNF